MHGTSTAGLMGPHRDHKDDSFNRDDSLSSGGGGGVYGGGVSSGGLIGYGDQRRYTERRKKTVRFDGQDSQNNEWCRWDSDRQGSQDSTTKDSGIDTSSTFTSSEESNRGDAPKVYPIEKTDQRKSLKLNYIQRIK